MIETITPSMVVQELPVRDPEFRIDPETQGTLIVPSALEVYRVNDRAEVSWTASEAPLVSEQAERILREIVAASEREAHRHPRSARARVNYGVALLNAGLLGNAADQFEMACTFDPKNLSALAHLARVRLLDERPADALDLANQVKDLDPTNALGALLIASAAMAEGDINTATESLNDARRLSPNNWVPEYLLSLILISQREGRTAIRHLRSAARHQPRSAAIQHALGVAFGLEGEWHKASRAFREALSLAPRRRDSALALAHVMLRRGAMDDAISVLSDWDVALPHDREVQELLASAYSFLKNYRAAKRHLLIALHSIPSTQEHAMDRGRLLNNIGVCSAYLEDYEDAISWYSKSLQTDRTSVAFRNLAKAYREIDNLDGARKVLAVAIAENPGDSDAKLLSGVVAAESGRADDAIVTLTALIQGGDAVAAAYGSLGWVLSDEKRDYSAALVTLSEGYARFGDDSVIANNLAYVNLMLGNVDAAREVLAKVSESEGLGSIYLTATRGLLHLWEGDFNGAERLYRAAESLARQQGSSGLAKSVRQKMHLEFARAFLRIGDTRSAHEHVKDGLLIKGRRSYVADLKGLNVRLLRA